MNEKLWQCILGQKAQVREIVRERLARNLLGRVAYRQSCELHRQGQGGKVSLQPELVKRGALQPLDLAISHSFAITGTGSDTQGLILYQIRPEPRRGARRSFVRERRPGGPVLVRSDRG